MDSKVIPRIIHYCWFGGKEIPSIMKSYIEGWKRVCPNWEIKLWNEKTFDITSNTFTKTAYEQKKFAYVSDYVRVWALYNFGGVYLDTDVELKLPLDDFLNYQAFSCFELPNVCFTSAVWGAMEKHSLSKKLLDYYNDRTYIISEVPNTQNITKILVRDFGINCAVDEIQVGNDGQNTIHIFASHFFCLDLPKNYATHHFYGSWLDEKNERNYKDFVHQNYYLENIKSYSYNRDLTKYVAKTINPKELVRLIYLYVKYKLLG